jgi:hypothetical protein
MRNQIPLVSAWNSFRRVQVTFKLKMYFILVTLDFLHCLTLISAAKATGCGEAAHSVGYKEDTMVCCMCLCTRAPTECMQGGRVSLSTHFFSKIT